MSSRKKITNMNKTNWKSRFDERFSSSHKDSFWVLNPTNLNVWILDSNRQKKFIQQELAAQKQQLIEEMEECIPIQEEYYYDEFEEGEYAKKRQDEFEQDMESSYSTIGEAYIDGKNEVAKYLKVKLNKMKENGS